MCLFSDCGTLSVEHGSLTGSTGTLYGTWATVICDEGYTLDGDSNITCTEDGWTNNTACNIQGLMF